MTGYAERRLSKAYARSEVVIVDERSKFVLMSDCHRGDATRADDFAQNQNACFYALDHYLRRGFTYVELGDGDELWENKSLEQIIEAHSHIFWLLAKFYALGRFLLVYGNHDMVKKSETFCDKHLRTFRDSREKRDALLFPGIVAHEALCFKHKETGREALALHGHQGDLINDGLWRVGRFLVRYFWRPLELFGVNDPTAAGKNHQKSMKTEKRLVNWAKRNEIPLIAGHTHRPHLPAPNSYPYFNDGSCVHPRCLTALEITGLSVTLVKWSVCVNSQGVLHICREELAGPTPLFDGLLT